jgi:1-acyl-sn-glycerol-3-phosphate acyltransferase
LSTLRSLLFLFGQILAAVLFWPATVASLVLPLRPRLKLIAWWARFVIWWLRATCGISHRVEGGENLIAGPAVIISKHQSAWETIAFQLIFPPLVFVLKRELLWIPFFGWGLAASSPVAIDRGSGRKALAQLIAQGKERLAAGAWVAIFPEGTRMAPGERGKYNPGGAMLAVEAGVPVVPVAHNAGRCWGRRSFLKTPGTITIVIGPAIETRDRSARKILVQTEEWIEETMKRIG